MQANPDLKVKLICYNLAFILFNSKDKIIWNNLFRILQPDFFAITIHENLFFNKEYLDIFIFILVS